MLSLYWKLFFLQLLLIPSLFRRSDFFCGNYQHVIFRSRFLALVIFKIVCYLIKFYAPLFTIQSFEKCATIKTFASHSNQ